MPRDRTYVCIFILTYISQAFLFVTTHESSEMMYMIKTGPKGRHRNDLGREYRVSKEGIMKKPLFFLSLGAAVGCAFFSIFIINVLAKEPARPEAVSYYTYIQIQPGDTLWSIAEAYTEGTDIAVEDYVKQLKQMNHLAKDTDTIHVGNYLTVMYRHPEKPEQEEEE